MQNNVIKTYTGKYIDITNPKTTDINIRDIAHALSNIGRYNGHYPRFLSVAEHSLNVEKQIVKRYPNATPEMRLHALLHDASEAYLCDLPRPIKNGFKAYYGYEQTFIDVIFKKFGLEEADYQKEIEEADMFVFDLGWNLWIHESDKLKATKTNEEWEKSFIDVYYKIMGERKYESAK
jgi:uncharacterized protein